MHWYKEVLTSYAPKGDKTFTVVKLRQRILNLRCEYVVCMVLFHIGRRALLARLTATPFESMAHQEHGVLSQHVIVGLLQPCGVCLCFLRALVLLEPEPLSPW
jgi:hypothetical protein